jgi:hypothetical protein
MVLVASPGYLCNNLCPESGAYSPAYVKSYQSKDTESTNQAMQAMESIWARVISCQWLFLLLTSFKSELHTKPNKGQISSLFHRL